MVRQRLQPGYPYLPPDLVVKKMGSIGKGIPGGELKIMDS